MAEISTINTAANNINSSSLYFAATQAASQQNLSQAKKTEKKTKTAFSQALSKNQEAAQFISEGLPAELAGLSDEEAVIFLKDAVDIAGDELQAKQNLESMEVYRKKVSQFMKYIVRNNFEFITKKRFGRNRKGKPIDPYCQIRVINQKLNQLASEMLILHGRNLNLLAKVEEINGMIVDLMAG